MKHLKTKKVLWILLSLIVLYFILKKSGVINSTEIKEVSTEKAVKRTIIETVTANGKVQPEVEVKISADVSGEITELLVKEGDQVNKGDLLVKINPDIYLSIKERAFAALNTAKASLANAKARYIQAKAQFLNAEATYKRNQNLFQTGAISSAENDASTATFEVAKAEVEASKQNVNGTEYQVKSAEASLKEANDNLLKTSILAPVNGTISQLNIEKGERVVGTSQMAGTEILRIANLNNMEVVVDVNENDIVRIKQGDTANIEIDAYANRIFKGLVTQIANSAKTSGLSADQVTNFEVKIKILSTSYRDLINPKFTHLSPFRPGMSATVDIKTKTVFNKLSVPIQAVSMRSDSSLGISRNKNGQNNDNHEVIFFIVEGKAKIQKVKTGIQDTKYIEIIEGITENQEIISGPYEAVSKELENNTEVKKQQEIKK